LKILYAGQSLSEPTGGGELSALAILRHLAVHHEVRAVGGGSTDSRITDAGGIDIHNHSLPAAKGIFLQSGHTEREAIFRQAIRDHLARFKPQLVLMQQPGFLLPGDLDERMRLVMFIRSGLCFGCWDPNPIRWRSLVASAFTFRRFQKFRPLLQRADLIVCNSEYMRKELFRRRGLNSVSIPPLVDYNEHDEPALSSSSRPFTTLVGLDPWKGGDIAIRVARAMPQRQFLFAAGNRANPGLVRDAEKLANVQLATWTDDMSVHYLKTRVLLIPSRVEPFGRVAVEAGRYGIPSVATATGGLPEAVGAGGILLPPAAGQRDWVDAITSLDDDKLHEQLASAAAEHARQLQPGHVLGLLESAIRKHTGFDLLGEGETKPTGNIAGPPSATGH
jgi:glycosyltransferase involved in cell wall biosynthesis